MGADRRPFRGCTPQRPRENNTFPLVLIGDNGYFIPYFGKREQTDNAIALDFLSLGH